MLLQIKRLYLNGVRIIILEPSWCSSPMLDLSAKIFRYIVASNCRPKNCLFFLKPRSLLRIERKERIAGNFFIVNSSKIEIWWNARFDLILEALAFSSTDYVSFWAEKGSCARIEK